MLQTRTKLSSVELDEYDCLSLAKIIESFNAPISEDHAWALIYQCMKALDTCIRDNLIRQPQNAGSSSQLGSNENPQQQHTILSVVSPDEISIQRDGIIHHKTWCNCSNHSSNRVRSRESQTSRRTRDMRVPIVSEDKAISQFGVVVYSALDAGIGHDKERHLSTELETIIETMALSSGDDEGIESDQYDTEIDEPLSLEHNRSQPRFDDSRPSRDHSDQPRVRRFSTSNACMRILKACASQLPESSDPNLHFRAVCRSLVSEALEVSSFMTKVSNLETEMDDDMKEIALQDWRRNFRQVMGDLITGAKLKHVDHTEESIEYELTPYEMLMEEIRARKYELNKVNIRNDSIQVIPTNAHDVILHFIRTRPPLKPVGERKLTPCRKESTPAEMLMESIRGSSARSSLRKTKGPPVKSLRMRLGYETSRCEEEEFESEENNNDARRKVTLDPSLVQNMLNFSDEESDEEITSPSYSRQTSRDSTLEDDESVSAYAKRKQIQAICQSEKKSQKQCIETKKTINKASVNYSKMAELLVDENSCQTQYYKGSNKNIECNNDPSPENEKDDKSIKETSPKKRQRRHSLTVCETPSRKKSDSDSISSSNFDDPETSQNSTFAQRKMLATQMSKMSMSATSIASASSVSNSRCSTPVESTTPDHFDDETDYDLNTPQMHANLHSEFLQSDGWATALQTLELTLEEVIHIRSVLTKAELENLPLDGNLKEDVEKGKVCFLCMKTRFGFLRRGCKCELCKQQICVKCCTKMNIPSDNFAQTPVINLEDSNKQKGVSAPNSPMSHRHKMSAISSLKSDDHNCIHESLEPGLNIDQYQSHASSFSDASQNNKKEDELQNDIQTSNDKNSGRRNHDQCGVGTKFTEGPALTVCVDCKEMILQVIRAQSTAKRIRMAKSLFTGDVETSENETFINSDVWGEEFY